MATQRSLTNRLRQHSRRSGFAVGLTMALAIAICIAGFIAIYVQLQPYISDFVSQDPPGEEARVVARPDPTEAPSEDDEAAADEEPAEDEEAAEEPEEEAPAEEEEPEPTEEPEGFTPDLQSNTEQSINLRSVPSATGGPETIVTVLPAATPLEGTGESEPAADPAADGDFWIEVETEAGEIGWIREIDSSPFEA